MWDSASSKTPVTPPAPPNVWKCSVNMVASAACAAAAKAVFRRPSSFKMASSQPYKSNRP